MQFRDLIRHQPSCLRFRLIQITLTTSHEVLRKKNLFYSKLSLSVLISYLRPTLPISCSPVVALEEMDVTVRSKTVFTFLSFGQTIASFQRNISQHCWVQHVALVWLPCCYVLRSFAMCCDTLRVAGFNFENGQIFHATFLHGAVVLWSGSCYNVRAWACALVRFSTRNMSKPFATGWPNVRNMLLQTMLRYFIFLVIL